MHPIKRLPAALAAAALLLTLAACFPQARAAAPAPTPPVCWPLSPAATSLSITTFPADRLEWMAAPASTASFSLTWYCAGAYGYTPHFLVGFKAEMAPDISALLRVFTFGSEAERRQTWAAGVSCLADGTQDPCAKYKVLTDGAAQQLAFGKAQLPSIEWRVRANGTYPTRPAYPTVNGVRSATALPAAVRATVGETCNCMALAIKESTSTYCAIPGLPAGAVALCGLVK